jgi:hypothetical protein
MPRNPFTLTRQTLYDLVWSKPMVEVAQEFNMSDRGLAKRCAAVDVPVPPRGYWARKAAGQDPEKIPLPKYRTRAGVTNGDKPVINRVPEETVREEPEVRFSIPSAPTNEGAQLDLESAGDLQWQAEHDDFERDPDNAIVVDMKPRRWHPAIAPFVTAYREEVAELLAARRAQKQYEKWPAYRKAKEPNINGWKWHWAERNGHILPFAHRARPFRFSPGTFQRGLAIANALSLEAESRGFTVTHAEDRGRIHIEGNGGRVHLRMAERTEKKFRIKKDHNGNPEQEDYKEPTGILTLFLEVSYTGPTFRETAERPLESRLNDVFLALNKIVINCRRESRIRAENEQLERERLARRAIIERRRQAQLKRRAEEAKHRTELLDESERWQRATLLQRYVQHIKRQVPQSGSTDTWAGWALEIAADLDPTAARTALLAYAGKTT